LTVGDQDLVFDCGLRLSNGVCYDDLTPGAVLEVDIFVSDELSVIVNPSNDGDKKADEIHLTYIRKAILLIGPRASLPAKWYESGSRVSQGDLKQKDVDKFAAATLTVLPLVDRPFYEPASNSNVRRTQYWGLPIQINVKDVKAVIGTLNGTLTKGRSKGIPFQMGIKAPLLQSI
jgi:hypothetical protein